MEEKKLRIRLFRSFDIIFGNDSIFPDQQLMGRLKSLLEYFILNKGVPLRPEQIVDDLWPENQYIDEKKVLQTYVHRLRSLLSKNNRFHEDFTPFINITSTKGLYQMELDPSVDLDTDAFMELCRSAETYNSVDEITTVLSAMSKIYTGHLLQDAKNENFIQLNRNYYLNIYCKTFLSCVKKLYDFACYEQVVSYCENFMAVDDVNEAINQIFIKALLKTGQDSYAARHYGYIEKKLEEELGIRPAKTLKDYHKEVNGEDPLDLTASGRPLHKEYIHDIVNELLMQRRLLDEKNEIFLKVVFNIENDNAEFPQDSLQYLLTHALNTNDLYAFISKHSAIVVLYNRSEGHRLYKEFESKINDAAEKEYPEMEIKLDISVIDFNKVM